MPSTRPRLIISSVSSRSSSSILWKMESSTV
jgi:hypothetical protein